MFTTSSIIALMAAALPIASASPYPPFTPVPVPTPGPILNNTISPINARQVPENYSWQVEWYPNGCGNGDPSNVYGTDDTLAACTSVNWSPDAGDPDAASISILKNDDDDRPFKFKLFSTNDCTTQIYQGEGTGCFSLPIGDDKIGAVIVYT